MTVNFAAIELRREGQRNFCHVPLYSKKMETLRKRVGGGAERFFPYGFFLAMQQKLLWE